MDEWKEITKGQVKGCEAVTETLDVPGGTLYRTSLLGEQLSIAQTFVPIPKAPPVMTVDDIRKALVDSVRNSEKLELLPLQLQNSIRHIKDEEGTLFSVLVDHFAINLFNELSVLNALYLDSVINK